MMDSAAKIFTLDQASVGNGRSSAVPGMDNQGNSGESFSSVYQQEKSVQKRSEAPGQKKSEETRGESRVSEGNERREQQQKVAEGPDETNKVKQVAEKAEGKGPEQAAERMEEKTSEEKALAQHGNGQQGEHGQHGKEQSSERHALLAELFKRSTEIELNPGEEPVASDIELLELPDEPVQLLDGEESTVLSDALAELEETVVEQAVPLAEDTAPVAVEADKDESLSEASEAELLIEDALLNPLAQTVKTETESAIDGDDVSDDLARRAALRPEQLQQNLKQALSEKDDKKPALSAEEIMESSEDLDSAVQQALHQLERNSARFESALAMKNAQQKQMTAADLVEQLTDKMALSAAGDRPSLSSTGSSAQNGLGLRPQSPLGTPSYVMDTPVESDEWGAVFSKRINFLVKNSVQTAELRLDPPEMGRVNIKIKMSQDGAAAIQIHAQHANVRDAIETAMPRLRELLSEGGISMGNVDVSTQFSQRQNENPGGFEGRLGKSVFPDSGMDGDDAEVGEGGPVRRISSDSLVDFYA